MIDNIALLPAYIAAGTAIAVLLADLIAPGRWALPPVLGGLGSIGTIVAAVGVGGGSPRSSFCMSGGGCSYLTDQLAALVTVVFAALTLGTLALSAPILRDRIVPAGEYTFLLACSMTGGVVLGSARDLVLLVVAVETVTLPLYILVGMRQERASSEASLTFFITSVVSTAIALLGAALLYAATGTVHLARLPGALAAGGHPAATDRLIPVGIVLLLAGLGFKVAAVPLHSWAPKTYDGAPLPVAAFLSTASKLAGVVALGLVAVALKPRFDVAGLALAVLATLTMTVGNLMALRQQRMVRLLAWSSIAQAGYLLAPLGGLAVASDGGVDLFGATIAYTVFFVLLEFGAFAAIVSVRGTADGGRVADFRGLARRAWLPTAALVLALTGLAGLPPGLAGLFAKVVVVKALVGSGTTWLAIVVALNAVIGLAYYARVVAALFSAPEGAAAGGTGAFVPLARLPRSRAVLAAVAIVAVAGLIVGLAPQPILDSARDAVAALP